MKGCEVWRDRIIVPGEGANTNMHSSWLLTSLFFPRRSTSSSSPQNNHTLFFSPTLFPQSHTWIHVFTCLFFFPSPGTFDSKFELNSQVHNYDTRSSKLFHIPKIRTNICKFSLRYQGPRFYNSLFSDIQSARTMTSFINGLKTSLIVFWLFFPICVCVCDYFYITYDISNDYFVVKFFDLFIC